MPLRGRYAAVQPMTKAPSGMSNWPRSTDARVEITHPGHRIEKTEVADDAAVTHHLDRQALAGPQAIGNGFAVERVQDVIFAADELLPQSRNIGLVEIVFEM